MSKRPQNRKLTGARARRQDAPRAARTSAGIPPQGRTARGQFAPGVSGNPGGRPRLPAEVRALAQQYAETAINKLAELLNCEDPMVRIHAARAILDRGYGKPEQAVAISPGVPFAEGSVVVTTQVEAAAAYERLMRGDLPLEAVRFEAPGLPAPDKATGTPAAAAGPSGGGVRQAKGAGADTGHRGAPRSDPGAEPPAAPAQASARGGS